MEIIEAPKSAVQLIRSLACRTWPEAYSAILSGNQVSYMLSKMYNAAELEKQMDNGHVFLLAYAEGNPLGFAGFSEEDPGSWKLHKIYVLPSAQGTGAGSALMQEVIKRIKAREGKKLSLNVNRNNKAIEFYQSRGFEIAETVDVNIGNGFFMNDYIMQKKLD